MAFVAFAEEFLMRCAEPLRSKLASRAELSSELAALHALAIAEWPLELDEGYFLAYVADRLDPSADANILGRLSAADLYLAFGCAIGDERAMGFIEEHFFPRLAGALAHMDRDGTLIDEVTQQLREKLFIPRDSEPPRIANFSGRGELYSWLRVAATRTALNIVRKGKREVRLADEHVAEAISDDLEINFLKKTYRQAFHAAFAQATKSLSSKDRNLLRHHLSDRLNIDELAGMHSVHRTTVARWLREARESLALRTREIMCQNLRLADDELHSIMALIRSRLDFSIRSYLDSGER